MIFILKETLFYAAKSKSKQCDIMLHFNYEGIM